ncbi:MAG: glycosyltransferase [Marinosulfonomonas sp.]
MPHFIVIADYQPEPAEGMQVISKTLIDGLRGAGHGVQVVAPSSLPKRLALIILRQPRHVVFTHGPGRGGVLASLVLRYLTRAQIVWVASRPDLNGIPNWLRGWRSAHIILCNRIRPDLKSVAVDATFVRQFIGIDPARLRTDDKDMAPWAELCAGGLPVALHIGHLRRNRGLDLLIKAKKQVGDRIEIVVQGSPTFTPDRGLVDELQAAGIHVYRNYVRNVASLYRAADLYLFPVNETDAGAIELPLSVLEAVASRTPVLTTDFGALPEAMADVSGVHFTRPDDFPSSLQMLLDAPDGLAIRPSNLPEDLHASRITEAVLRAAEMI